MPKTVEGYLVTERYEKDGKKSEPKNLGVVFSEYDIEELIRDNSGYYEEQPKEYSRSFIKNGMDGIIYQNKKGDEMIWYTWERCLVIAGV